ncbi:MAG: hypothetical protein PHZ03_06675 [Syntrophomonas sp.]|nr:hypothetical protein [Syntrophomonas sp.]
MRRWSVQRALLAKEWQITMENNNVHYQTRFIDSNKDVIAQCDCKGIPTSDDINIQVFKPELDIYQVATLGLIQLKLIFWLRHQSNHRSL